MAYKEARKRLGKEKEVHQLFPSKSVVLHQCSWKRLQFAWQWQKSKHDGQLAKELFAPDSAEVV